MGTFNIGSANTDQSIYSAISDLTSLHDETEPISDHLYPTSIQDYPNSIFVQIPVCHNTQHQISRQQANEIKSEPIKSEVENVNTSLPSTQSTICSKSATITTSIHSANICSQQQTPPTLITARPKSSIKWFRCTQCPFISISESGIKNHNEKSHSGNETSVLKPLKCFGCANVFYTKNSLKVHLVKDHQMDENEIKYLVQSLVLDGESVDDTAPAKQKIYLKNFSILKAPEFPTNEYDNGASELLNHFCDENHYSKEYDQHNTSIELDDDVSDDFINLIDDDFLVGQSNELMENYAPRDCPKKIYVRDVNNLKNPSYATAHQFLFDDNPDFGIDMPQHTLIDTPPSPIPSTSIQANYQNQNFLPSFDNSMHEMSMKKKPCKIQIKNVDILPKPISLQTSGNSLISSSSSQPQPLYSWTNTNPFEPTQSTTGYNNPNSLSLLWSPEKATNENRSSANAHIKIKNIDNLKQNTSTAPAAKKNMLHLRTVDDINLMNVNEAQNHREAFQEELFRTSTTDNCNENYNEVLNFNMNNEQYLESAFADFFTFYQNNDGDRQQFPFQDMHTVNFPSNNGNNFDFHQSNVPIECPINDVINLENIIDSTTSSMDEKAVNNAVNLENIIDSTTSSMDEKAVNKMEQLNGNSESQSHYNNSDGNVCGGFDFEKAFDQEILFDCAEEVISCQEICDRLTPNNDNVAVAPDVTAEAKETSKIEEPAKARIYVVSNLMKTTEDVNANSKQLNEVIPQTEPNSESQMVEVIESNDEEDVERAKTVTKTPPQVVHVLILDDTKKGKRKKGIGRPKGGRNTRYSLTTTNSKDDIIIKYQCTQNCAMRFSSTQLLSFHEQCHDPSQKNRIICPECKENDFRSFNTLHTHLWRQHSIDMELYSCESCDFKTPILSRLINTHMRIHSEERNFKCEMCSKAFKNAKQLKNHRSVHNDTRVIQKCEYCDKFFNNRKYLRIHVKSVHEMLNDYKCKVCNSTFSSVAACRTHMLNHTLSKKYECQKCFYATNDRSCFNRHVKKHEGVKSYECRFCPFKCIQSHPFKSHISKSHPDLANEVLFSCQKCPYITVKRSNFDVHQLQHEFKEHGTLLSVEGQVMEEVIEEDDDEDEDQVLIIFHK